MKLIADTEQDFAVVLNEDNEPVTATTLANFGSVLSSSNSFFDSGLIPQNGSGILWFRKSGDYTQIAYQEAPTASLVKWGEYERDNNVDVFTLAHPYKIWIVDYSKDLLVGLRHFFSPEPIFSEDDTLYHTPYPNTNCRGYNGTSVGWVCLYRTGSSPLLTVQEKVQYAWQRESGLHEPYNNANMSSTDGPRFYRDNGLDNYIEPNRWAQRTEKEGTDWICDPNLLIPIKTDSPLHVTHVATGELYTFGKAMNAPYYPYYPHNLSQAEKKFYEAGWGKGSMSMDFDPQTLSKLSLVDLPSGIDMDTVVSTLNVKRRTPIDFDIFDHDAAVAFSETVINAMHECCFCNKVKQSTHLIVPYFVPSEVHEDKDILFATDPYSQIHEPFHVCSECSNGKGMIFNTPDDSGEMMEAFFFFEKGAKYFKKHVWDEYFLMEDGDLTSPDNVVHSRYLVKSHQTGAWVPQSSTVTCIQCETHYEYDMNEDGEPILDQNKFIGILFQTNYPHYRTARYTVSCSSNSCKNKRTKLSNYLIDDPEAVATENGYLAEVIKDPSTAIRPLGEVMDWLFQDTINENMAFNENDLSAAHILRKEDVKLSDVKLSFFDHESISVQNNVMVQVHDEEASIFKVVKTLHEVGAVTSDFGMHDFDYDYGEATAYFMMADVGGVWKVFIDRQEVLEGLEVCQCSVVNPEDKIHTMINVEGCNMLVCDFCIKKNPTTNEKSYNPIIVHPDITQ